MFTEKKFSSADFFKAVNDFRNWPKFPPPYKKIWRYFSAVLIVSLSLFADLHFQTFHGFPSILLFASIIFSTWYSGFWPGMVTVVVALLSIDYFFTKPIDTLTFNSNYIVQSVVFVSAAILISSLVESQHRAEQVVNLLIKKQKRFIADASHELFTPLSIVKAQSEVILQSVNPDLASYKEVTLSNIQEVDRMTKIVENLLEMSRGELKAKSEPTEQIELSQFTKDILNKVKILAEGKNISLSMPSQDGGKIKANPAELTNIIINLLQNAIQYTPEGGQVSAGVLAKSKSLLLIIQDNGMGIEPEHLPYIFDPFYKTDEARKRRKSGAGLGLSIVKSAVEFHKATINFESKVNSGTTVTVEFPKA